MLIHCIKGWATALGGRNSCCKNHILRVRINIKSTIFLLNPSYSDSNSQSTGYNSLNSFKMVAISNTSPRKRMLKDHSESFIKFWMTNGEFWEYAVTNIHIEMSASFCPKKSVFWMKTSLITWIPVLLDS